MAEKKKTRSAKKPVLLISWVILLIACAAAVVIIPNYEVFPSGLVWPLRIGLAVLALVMLVLTLKVKAGMVIPTCNVIIAVLLGISCVLMPQVEERNEVSFSEPSRIGNRYFNLYVLDTDYRTEHSDLFTATMPSDELEDYTNASFIYQTELNQTDQSTAYEEVKTAMGVTSLETENYDSLMDALEAFYNGEGDVLILNEAFVETIETIEGYENFSDDTKVIYTVTLADEEETEAVETGDTFMVYIAGSDTRSSSLSLYGRTDVDMIVVMNPSTMQVLIVSIPRDFYVENPALDYGLDKLTHLGNDGVQNTMDGLNNLFSIDISNYLLTNFAHFVGLIDDIGGIDIENPYEFTTDGGNGGAVTVDGVQYGGTYTFAAGSIHLDGNMALSYSRERYNLSNGDYGRNAHQAIVMEGILAKIMELTRAGEYSTVLSAISDGLLTNINVSDLYDTMKTVSSGTFTYISYHLGGEGTYAGTASMGFSRMLYVCKPFDSQISFITEQVNAMFAGETLTQQDLPDAAATTFVEN